MTIIQNELWVEQPVAAHGNLYYADGKVRSPWGFTVPAEHDPVQVLRAQRVYRQMRLELVAYYQRRLGAVAMTPWPWDEQQFGPRGESALEDRTRLSAIAAEEQACVAAIGREIDRRRQLAEAEEARRRERERAAQAAAYLEHQARCVAVARAEASRRVAAATKQEHDQ